MKITVNIDGKICTTNQNLTILELAKQNNIIIPSLCYLKNINEPSSCRVCVVELEGAKSLVTACSTKAKDGMVIKTNSLRVIKARKTALELLLSNHNKKCLSCGKNLKCELQKLCKQYQCDDEKFSSESISNEIDDSNNAIVRDMSKCILCGKCVSVCSKIQGCDALGKVGRGFGTQIGTSFKKPLNKTSCVACGQCVLVCPTGALMQKNDVNKVLKILDNNNTIKIAQIAPAVRVSISEEFGGKIGKFAEGKVVTALKQCGFDYVFDISCGADFTIIEEATELLKNIKIKEKQPLFTSCCPAWFNFIEKKYPEFKKNLSSSKSPSEMLASLVKYYFERQGKNVEIVSFMPCTGKKQEISRFNTISASLTTRELGELIKIKGIKFDNLKNSSFDKPFGDYSGGGLIFGASGGVTEAALRFALYKQTGKHQEIIKEVRNFDKIREVEFRLKNTSLKLAVVSGLANAKTLLTKIISGEVCYDFVEVMACTGGCVNGGGQSYVDYNNTTLNNVIEQRSMSLYKKDEKMVIKSAEQNRSVENIYDNLLNNDKHLIHKLLHYK